MITTFRFIPLLLLVLFCCCKSDAVGPIEGAGAGVSPDPALHSEYNSGTAQTNPATENETSSQVHVPPGSVTNETEPNDNPQSAMTVPVNAAIEATIGSPKDTDWFRIVPGGRSQLRAEIGGTETIDLEFSLYDDSGSKLWRKIDNFGTGSGETITNYVVEGPCLLKVKPKGKGTYQNAPYRLSVVTGPVDATLEEEPNGSTLKATPLPIGETLSGYVNNKDDLDVFRIQPEPVNPEARYVIEAEGVDGVRASLLVFRANPKDSTKTHLQADKTCRLSGVGPITEAQPLYVAVQPHEGFHLSSRYQLKVTEANAAPTATELEPNDALSIATELDTDEAGQGSIGWALDEDWYRVKTIPPGVARVDVTGTSDVTLQVRVYSGDHQLLGEFASTSPGGDVIIPSVTVGTSGLTVRINSQKPEEFRPDRYYGVRVSWRDGGGEEREPNDSLTSSKNSPLDIGIRRMGHIGHPKDVDHFELRVETQEKGEILTIRLHAPPQLPLLVTVLKQDGEEILNPTQVPGDEERTVTHYFESGVYVIQVRPASDVTTPESPYSLSVLR